MRKHVPRCLLSQEKHGSLEFASGAATGKHWLACERIVKNAVSILMKTSDIQLTLVMYDEDISSFLIIV